MTSHSAESCQTPSEEEKNNYFQNKDGLWIYSRSWGEEENKPLPLSILFFAHGFGEHCQKRDYNRLFDHFSKEEKVIVYALDHQGHGRSNGERVHVVNFMDYVEDFFHLIESKLPHHPNVPFFVMGHSMGSFIASRMAFEIKNRRSFDPFSKDFKGAILSGLPMLMDPALDNDEVRSLLREISKTNPKGPVTELGELSFDDNSRNAESVKVYSEDPLVYKGCFKALHFLEFMNTMDYLKENAKYFDSPVLLLHGSGDKIALPSSSTEFYQNISSTEKRLVFYDEMYHDEILEETNKHGSYKEIKEFIHRRNQRN